MPEGCMEIILNIRAMISQQIKIPGTWGCTPEPGWIIRPPQNNDF